MPLLVQAHLLFYGLPIIENACQFQMLARVRTLALDLLPQTQPVPQHLCLGSVSCDDHGVLNGVHVCNNMRVSVAVWGE